MCVCVCVRFIEGGNAVIISHPPHLSRGWKKKSLSESRLIIFRVFIWRRCWHLSLPLPFLLSLDGEEKSGLRDLSGSVLLWATPDPSLTAWNEILTCEINYRPRCCFASCMSESSAERFDHMMSCLLQVSVCMWCLFGIAGWCTACVWHALSLMTHEKCRFSQFS